MSKKYKIGYTTGVYDMFHIGHLNILRRAKEQCETLVVGVTTDELCYKRKQKYPIINEQERMAIVEAIRYVDKVVPHDFFRNKEIRSHYPHLVDMVVDYSQYVVSKYRYISDASYRWNIITEPETNDLHPEVKNAKVGGFKNLLALVQDTDYSYVISTHPHRWMSAAWKINLKIGMFRVVREIVMAARHIPGVEWLLNKFYFLAKKI